MANSNHGSQSIVEPPARPAAAHFPAAPPTPMGFGNCIIIPPPSAPPATPVPARTSRAKAAAVVRWPLVMLHEGPEVWACHAGHCQGHSLAADPDTPT